MLLLQRLTTMFSSFVLTELPEICRFFVQRGAHFLIKSYACFPEVLLLSSERTHIAMSPLFELIIKPLLNLVAEVTYTSSCWNASSISCFSSNCSNRSILEDLVHTIRCSLSNHKWSVYTSCWFAFIYWESLNYPSRIFQILKWLTPVVIITSLSVGEKLTFWTI